MVVELFGMIIVMSVWSAIRGFAPVEVVIFRNTNGKIQFDLVKEKKQAKEFEEFVRRIVTAICGESFSGNLTTEAQLGEPLLESSVPNYFWIASVALGGLSICLPQIASVLFPAADWTFFVLFPCSFGGIGLCVCSFLNAERFRYISLVGAALSIAPAFLLKWQ
jgi:hypothetical protein